MMESKYRDLWVFAEQVGGDLVPVVPQLLGEGSRLLASLDEGSKLCAVVCGSDNDAQVAANSCFTYGADKVYIVADPNLKNYTTDGYTKAVCAAITEYEPDIMLYGATPLGRDLAPRVAARLGLGLTADCTKLDIKADDYLDYLESETMSDVNDLEVGSLLLKQTKPSFGGKMLATMICPSPRPQMATVRPGVMTSPVPDNSRHGEIIAIDADIKPEDIRIKIKGRTIDPGEHVNLSEADIIVAGGRGLGDADGFRLIQELANTIGGEVAASGAPVDADWIDEDLMIGQTGVIVKPKIYIACGISGSIQHLAGIKDADTVIAINTDPAVPIFEVADYCIVGDLYEVVPALIGHWHEFITK